MAPADPDPRVLIVNHAGEPGGAEQVLLELASAIADRCAVLLFADGPLRTRLRERGVRCVVAEVVPELGAIRRDRPLLRSALPAATGIARLVRAVAAAARSADVIHANTQKAFVASALAAPLARRPLVWHLHDILDRHHFGRAQVRVVTGLANRVAAAVVVPSAAAGAAFVAAGGRASLVRVVPNGVAPPPAGGPDREAVRRVLGLPGGTVVGVFSRIARWKGQDLALDAVALLPGVHCLLVGGPHFGENAYLAALHRQAAALGIADRVTFAGHRDDVRTLMRAVDVCVHPSTLAEPFGLTVAEAMSAGIPVVASGTGAIPEIVTHGVTGLVVPAGDPGAIAAAVARLRDDPASALRIAEAGRVEVADRFALATMTSGVDAVHREVSGRPAVAVTA
jgi:glycosyltransferase involved in cell wall biosynthesis